MKSSGIVYLIKIKDTDYRYVGSTSCSLSLRRCLHKLDRRRDPNRKIYKVLNNYDWDEILFIKLEELDFENRRELLDREYEWIDRICPNLNSFKPRTTHKHREVKICELCGGKYNYYSLRVHEISKKHQSKIT